MIPNIEIAGRVIAPWYMLAALAGILIALFFSYFLAKKHGYDEVTVFITLLVGAGTSLIGSHLLYGIVNYRLIITALNNLDKITSFEVFLQWMQEIFGGAVYYGGLITGMIGGWLYLRHAEKGDRAPYVDMCAIALPLFHGFGRIGCFLAGCCYGVESSCGITYHHSIIESANGVSRFPVQLVESALNFLLFLLLWMLFRKGRARGRLLWLYLLIYPIYRFILEFFRGDTYRGFIGFLSTSQIVSVILVVISAAVLIVKHNKENSRASAAISEG
jgi:phosphatidylglycerol:prolipoprotein diacylglycerol transferase